MTRTLSPNTQAILLVTAPLIAGRGTASADLLSPGEYKRLARRLRDMQREPADLLSPSAADLIHDCQPAVDETRLRRLLGRGLLLAQVVERWHSRAIWVISRADADYPSHLRTRLREDAPAVLYGCGKISQLKSGGLAVVGSRDVDDALIAYTTNVARLAADAGKTIISGGARGIDQAAMGGALEQGGHVIGVLADSLEKTVMNRENRDAILNGRLVVTSPYDPSAGFNVGNAMQRNKVIYALADASLVVNAEFNKGGTWAGAAEQLDKLRMVPVYVRSSGAPSRGLEALLQKGAIPWPDPQDARAFEGMFNTQGSDAVHAGPSVFSIDPPADAVSGMASQTRSDVRPAPDTAAAAAQRISVVPQTAGTTVTSDTKIPPVTRDPENDSQSIAAPAGTANGPAEALLAAVREALQQILVAPMRDIEVAEALDISPKQAKIWLQRFVDEGVLEKRKRPSVYVAKQARLI